MFARIWLATRSTSVLDPITAAKMYKTILSNDGMTADVVDLFILPDYKKYLAAFSQTIGRFAKTIWAQLQFRFTAVPVTPDYPLGVKCQYRAYGQSKVYEIVFDSDNSNELGARAQQVIVHTYPSEHEKPLHILVKNPTGKPIPEPFVQGSRQTLEDTCKKVSQIFKHLPNTLANWQRFKDQAPQSDDVSTYMDNYYIPFNGILFSDVGTPPTRAPCTIPREDNLSLVLSEDTLETTNCITFRGSGNQHTPARRSYTPAATTSCVNNTTSNTYVSSSGPSLRAGQCILVPESHSGGQTVRSISIPSTEIVDKTPTVRRHSTHACNTTTARRTDNCNTTGTPMGELKMTANIKPPAILCAMDMCSKNGKSASELLAQSSSSKSDNAQDTTSKKRNTITEATIAIAKKNKHSHELLNKGTNIEIHTTYVPVTPDIISDGYFRSKATTLLQKELQKRRYSLKSAPTVQYFVHSLYKSTQTDDIVFKLLCTTMKMKCYMFPMKKYFMQNHQ